MTILIPAGRARRGSRSESTVARLGSGRSSRRELVGLTADRKVATKGGSMRGVLRWRNITQTFGIQMKVRST